MCLAVPGKILSIYDEQADAPLTRTAKVDFQGSRLDVSLAFTPEAAKGDWVLVHAGFAIRRLEESEALETWEYLEAAEIAEMRAPDAEGDVP